MPDDAAHDDVRATPPLRTLADKVNWLISLISTARPADRGPYSNAEVAALIREATGEPVTGTTIRKLRNGQAANPQKRLIGAMAQFFGVPPDFFFDDYDDDQVSLIQEQVEIAGHHPRCRHHPCPAPGPPGAEPGSPAADPRLRDCCSPRRGPAP